MDRLPAKLTPPPTRPKIPRPRVSGESSRSLNDAPTASPEATPLSLLAVPKRFVDGNTPLIESAGSSEARWMLGMESAVLMRTSGRFNPLRIAGFQ